MLVIYKYSMVYNIFFIYIVLIIWKYVVLMVNID